MHAIALSAFACRESASRSAQPRRRPRRVCSRAKRGIDSAKRVEFRLAVAKEHVPQRARARTRAPIRPWSISFAKPTGCAAITASEASSKTPIAMTRSRQASRGGLSLRRRRRIRVRAAYRASASATVRNDAPAASGPALHEVARRCSHAGSGPSPVALISHRLLRRRRGLLLERQMHALDVARFAVACTGSMPARRDSELNPPHTQSRETPDGLARRRAARCPTTHPKRKTEFNAKTPGRSEAVQQRRRSDASALRSLSR